METLLDDLKESNEFLNLLLDNINSAVLIADENFQIHQFNESFLNLFDNAAECILEKGFGNVTGCVNAVLENKPCGETSQCANCVLRRSLIQNLLENAPVDDQYMERLFYIGGRPVQKYLRFSTRRIIFRGLRMFLVIIYDVTDIEKKKLELQQKQKQIDQDLAAAAAIQQSLLPERTPAIPSIRTAWKFVPCEQIGGDIFNVIKLDETHLGIYMLDACGHGVPAALIAVAVSQFLGKERWIQANSVPLLSPENVLNSLDREFPFERFQSYFTIVSLTIDTASGYLTYSCAGHPPPVLLRSNRRLELLLRRGPVIGSGCDACFRQERKYLSRGDKVLLYTDGIFEARCPAGEEFGKRRFFKTIENYRHLPVEDLVDAVQREVEEFRRGAKPDDDITLLGLEYVGDGVNHFMI